MGLAEAPRLSPLYSALAEGCITKHSILTPRGVTVGLAEALRLSPLYSALAEAPVPVGGV